MKRGCLRFYKAFEGILSMISKGLFLKVSKGMFWPFGLVFQGKVVNLFWKGYFNGFERDCLKCLNKGFEGDILDLKPNVF